jgi:hypothetical protein
MKNLISGSLLGLPPLLSMGCLIWNPNICITIYLAVAIGWLIACFLAPHTLRRTIVVYGLAGGALSIAIPVLIIALIL